jgi:glycosyltransferase involved in cell wall biosynthesis
VISSIRSENLGSRLRALALQWTDSLATVTTTNSDRVAQKLVHAGAVSPRRVRVIPNGLDMGAFGPHLRETRMDLRRTLGVGDSEFLWVAAGRLEEPKDYPNLLSAVSLLAEERRPMKVAIAGQGPLGAQIRAQIATLSLVNQVLLLGLRDDIPACMAAADATVLASAWEGSPNAVIESLAAGTPVVCTDVGGVLEIVSDGRTGLIAPSRNPHALAAAMRAMMTRSAHERQAMGAAGRAHIEDRFALERVVDRWTELFDGLLEQVA